MDYQICLHTYEYSVITYPFYELCTFKTRQQDQNLSSYVAITLLNTIL